MDSLIGQDLGPYHVDEHIGSGGFADIYKATHVDARRVVALKVLSESFSRNPKRVHRFEEEARGAATLQHPNIIHIIETLTVGHRHAIVMEYVDGADLGKWLANGKPMEVKRILVLMRQICDGLGFAHTHGVIHRDIKPPNILVNRDGRAIITDFGVAKVRARTDGLTTEGSLLGTPEYMSPELVLGEEIDNRSDLYSVGVMAYQMLTGTVPFRSENSMAVALMHTRDVAPPPSRHNFDLPEEVDLVVGKMMNRDRALRYPDAASFYADFHAALRQPELIRAKRKALLACQPAPLGYAKPVSRTAGFWVGAGGSAVLAALVAVWFTDLRERPTPTPPAPPTPTARAGPSGGYLEFQRVLSNTRALACDAEYQVECEAYDAALERFGEVASQPTRMFQGIVDLPATELAELQQLTRAGFQRYLQTSELREMDRAAAIMADLNFAVRYTGELLADAQEAADPANTRRRAKQILVYEPEDYAGVAASQAGQVTALESNRNAIQALVDALPAERPEKPAASLLPPAEPRKGMEELERAEYLARNGGFDEALAIIAQFEKSKGASSRTRAIRADVAQRREEYAFSGKLEVEATFKFHEGDLRGALALVDRHLKIVPGDERGLRLRERIVQAMGQLDMDPPVISSPQGVVRRDIGQVVFSAAITDNKGIKSAQVCFELVAGAQVQCIRMTPDGAGNYEARFPIPDGKLDIGFYIEATDERGNIGRSQ